MRTRPAPATEPNTMRASASPRAEVVSARKDDAPTDETSPTRTALKYPFGISTRGDEKRTTTFGITCPFASRTTTFSACRSVAPMVSVTSAPATMLIPGLACEPPVGPPGSPPQAGRNEARRARSASEVRRWARLECASIGRGRRTREARCPASGAEANVRRRPANVETSRELNSSLAHDNQEDAHVVEREHAFVVGTCVRRGVALTTRVALFCTARVTEWATGRRHRPMRLQERARWADGAPPFTAKRRIRFRGSGCTR